MKRQLALHLTHKKRPWNKGKTLSHFGSVSAHKRRVNPGRKVRRRRRKSARRSNPTHVLLANPQRRRRRRVRHGGGASVSHRRVRTNPTRRRRRSIHRVMRSHGIRRRANPLNLKLNLKSAGTILRMAVCGGVGVIVARMAGTFYSRNIAKHVLGDSAGDPKSFRQILNEGLRLAMMAAATVATHELLRLAKLPERDRYALLAGGLAETGRQAIGITIQKLKPDVDRGRYGLDGPGDADGMVDAEGNVWIERNGQYQLLEGVEPADSFAGVESAESFAGGW